MGEGHKNNLSSNSQTQSYANTKIGMLVGAYQWGHHYYIDRAFFSENDVSIRSSNFVHKFFDTTKYLSQSWYVTKMVYDKILIKYWPKNAQMLKKWLRHISKLQKFSLPWSLQSYWGYLSTNLT